MKVYFCGSIRGGRDDAELYHRMVAKLQSFATVLTEHVGRRELGDTGQTHLVLHDTRTTASPPGTTQKSHHSTKLPPVTAGLHRDIHAVPRSSINTSICRVFHTVKYYTLR